MTTGLWINVVNFNQAVAGWTVHAWNTVDFPTTPTPNAQEPAQTSPDATVVTTGSAIELTGLNALDSYYLCVKDPIAGVNRWFPVPGSRLGNSSGDPLVITVPAPTTVPTADLILDQAVGSLVVWSTDT